MHKAITSEDYDRNIRAEGLQFQVDSFYQPQKKAMQRRIKLVIEALNPSCGERILDVGCGPGAFSFHCARRDARVWGIDYSAESIRTARILCEQFGVVKNTSFLIANAVRLPFRNSTFDKIVAADFIEHISYTDKQCVLSQMYRVLKTGGSLIILTPNGIREKIGGYYWRIRHLLLGNKIPVSDLHYGLTGAKGFARLLRKHGFSFTLKYDDVTRPYLARLPLFRSFLALNLLFVVTKTGSKR